MPVSCHSGIPFSSRFHPGFLIRITSKLQSFYSRFTVAERAAFLIVRNETEKPTAKILPRWPVGFDVPGRERGHGAVMADPGEADFGRLFAHESIEGIVNRPVRSPGDVIEAVLNPWNANRRG
jgi:hypothetical protein